jgi:D-alanine-D-alanine ligase-like ATP-grasp enzyme
MANKVRIKFLAAGNVYFDEPATVLRRSDQEDFNFPTPIQDALTKARKALQVVQEPTWDIEAFTKHEPSTSVGHIARLAEALQFISGIAGLKEPGWYEISADTGVAGFPCVDRTTGHLAAMLALNILARGKGEELAKLAQKFLEAGKPWARPLTKAALARNIPVSEVAGPGSPFLALGQGTKRRLFWKQKHFTPYTSQVATALSSRKDLTSQALREAGIPAARNVVVGNAETAVRVAEKLGYPVVVKPAAADFGRGVSVENESAEEVRSSFNNAAKYGPVIVEEQIVGDHHRLLIIHGRCVAVTRRLPPRVVGDGISTISQLVETVNQTRTDHLSSAGAKIKLDEIAHGVLKAQGMTSQSIPKAGVFVLLRGNANQSSGGTVELVTATTHPDVVRLALKAAAILGIDVAGVDYITQDITSSPKTTNGAICEVNVTPGFVNQGKDDDLLGAFLDPFFPTGDDGRMEVTCYVSNRDNPSAFVDALASLFDEKVARSDQLRFWNESSEASLPRRTAAVLADPLALSALITCTSHEIRVAGLGLDRCSLVLIEDDVPRDVLNALLRIANNVIMPASIYEKLAAEPFAAKQKKKSGLWRWHKKQNPVALPVGFDD